jgi:hypothetical protein
VALGDSDARAVGLLLARTGTSDIADAHVVICAQGPGSPLSPAMPVISAESPRAAVGRCLMLAQPRAGHFRPARGPAAREICLSILV